MFKYSIPVKELIEIFTDDGWKQIDFIHKTEKTKEYLILFESGIEIECADKHGFINKNYDTIYAENLKIGDEIISEEGIDIVFDIFETDNDENFYDFTLKDHHKYFSNGILSHNTNFLVNVCSRQVLKGLNPIIFSLETSEDALCQRLDSIYSNQEINSIYVKDKNKQNMVKALKEIKKNNGLGHLIIKELSPGKTSVQDLDNIIRELKYRKIKAGPIYVDYLQLMKGTKGDARHEELKHISEDLRTLSLNHQTPVISVCQLNKDGIFANFDSVDYTYTAGSIDIAATADFMAIFGKSEDDLVYESELHYKLVKNRLGGRVGEKDKLYIDKNSLKMYDITEFNLWVKDASITGDKESRKKLKRNRG